MEKTREEGACDEKPIRRISWARHPAKGAAAPITAMPLQACSHRDKPPESPQQSRPERAAARPAEVSEEPALPAIPGCAAACAAIPSRPPMPWQGISAAPISLAGAVRATPGSTLEPIPAAWQG